MILRNINLLPYPQNTKLKELINFETFNNLTKYFTFFEWLVDLPPPFFYYSALRAVWKTKYILKNIRKKVCFYIP
jgi:hypothetical protein